MTDRTLFAQDQAVPAGSARPCAHQLGSAAWLGSTTSGIATFMDDRNVTKRCTRWLGRRLT